MTELTIRIELPDEARVIIDGPETDKAPQAVSANDDFEAFWDFSTDNSCVLLFEAMAEEQLELGGPFSFERVAKRMGVTHSQALTYNRNAGRGARVWREQHGGAEPPIHVVPAEFVKGRRQRTFRLPEGVPERILQLVG